MTSRPARVSVAVVTFNQIEFLEPCLQSILAQGYPNLQIVVADDGSTDGTVAVLHRLARQYPDVFTLVLAPVNRGITANCDAALWACDGQYVAWTGGDDLMLPGKLAAQVALLESRPDVALCFHDLDVFESSTGRVLRRFNSGPGSFRPRVGGAEVVIEHGTFMGACSVMVRRTACPSEGFDARIPVASDWLFWIRTAMVGQVAYLDEVFGRYRRHARSVTAGSTHPAEEFITLAIVEAEHPQYLRAVRRSRARRYYLLAARTLLQGDPTAARRYLAAAARQGRPTLATLQVGWGAARAKRPTRRARFAD